MMKKKASNSKKKSRVAFTLIFSSMAIFLLCIIIFVFTRFNPLASRTAAPKTEGYVAVPTATVAMNQTVLTPMPSTKQIDLSLKGLWESASIAFNPPATLEIDEQYVLTLSMWPSANPEIKKDGSFTETNETDSTIETYSIQITPVMEARLSGEGFKITPHSPDIQLLSYTEETRWQWTITPVKEGTQLLNLTVIAHIGMEDSILARMVFTNSWPVEIYVTSENRVKRFVTQNLTWLWGAILLPVGGWILSRIGALRKRRQRSSILAAHSRKVTRRPY